MIQALEIHMAPGNDDYQAVWRRVIPALSDESTASGRRIVWIACMRARSQRDVTALFKKFCKRDFCDEVRDFKIPEPEAVAS